MPSRPELLLWSRNLGQHHEPGFGSSEGGGGEVVVLGPKALDHPVEMLIIGPDTFLYSPTLHVRIL